jgi:hypothetical protein
MRITATTTIAYTLGQKAKAENRKGWQTVKAVKALTCSQSVIPSLDGWRDGWLQYRIAKTPLGDVYVNVSVCIYGRRPDSWSCS